MDEHTIEMYVLGSDLVAGRRDEIESHLKECAGCRTLAEQMEEFYRRAGDGLKESLRLEEKPSTSLVRSRSWIEPYDHRYVPPIPYRPTTMVGRFATFVRRHPVTAGVGSFAAVAALAVLTFVTGKDLLTDTNPAYVHLNPEQSRIDVYNRENDMLWSLPSRGVHKDQWTILEDVYRRIVIYDLDGDGQNEVLTSLPIGDEEAGSPRHLTVLSHNKRILRQVTFKQHIEFRGAKYDERLGVDYIICDRYSPTHEPEILVRASNARSPTVLFRLDREANQLGSYIHYGDFQFSLVDWGDGGKKVFLFGQNDLGETDSVSSAFLSILDPEKISGRAESSGSPGFGLPPSQADLFYIRFPLSDMNYAWKTHANASYFHPTSTTAGRIYRVLIQGGYLDTLGQHPANPHFEYVLSENLTVSEVKYSSATLRLRQRLVDQGKLRGTFDQAYLDNLKHGVRYWDGKVWSAKPVRVRNPVTPTLP